MAVPGDDGQVTAWCGGLPCLKISGSHHSRAETRLFGWSRAAPANFSQQLPTARRIAALLARHKTGFRLPLGNDVRDQVVKQPLHARAGGTRSPQQRFVPGIVTTIRDGFHFTIFRCCAGVTTRGEANLSLPRLKSRVLCFEMVCSLSAC